MTDIVKIEYYVLLPEEDPFEYLKVYREIYPDGKIYLAKGQFIPIEGCEQKPSIERYVVVCEIMKQS